MIVSDDLGCAFDLPGSPERVVSLVPSMTESMAATVPDLLVGATDWCTHPADLDVTRVRGTKNPDLAAIVGLRPDLVIANKEENRELDVRRLREPGIEVWVTVTETVAQAIASLERLVVEALGVEVAGLAPDGRGLWPARCRTRSAGEWCRSGGTRGWWSAGHVHRRPAPTAGAHERLRRHADRYPHVRLDEVDGRPTWCCCPTSPTCSPPTTAPRRFGRPPLVSGRLLTWYGPSLVQAQRNLAGWRARCGPEPTRVASDTKRSRFSRTS